MISRAVSAAIVDVDDLRVDVPQPVEHRPHAREQLLETRALVVDRDDDGQRGVLEPVERWLERLLLSMSSRGAADGRVLAGGSQLVSGQFRRRLQTDYWKGLGSKVPLASAMTSSGGGRAAGWRAAVWLIAAACAVAGIVGAGVASRSHPVAGQPAGEACIVADGRSGTPGPRNLWVLSCVPTARHPSRGSWRDEFVLMMFIREGRLPPLGPPGIAFRNVQLPPDFESVLPFYLGNAPERLPAPGPGPRLTCPGSRSPPRH